MKWKPSALAVCPYHGRGHDHGLGEVLRSLLSWNVLGSRWSISA